mmetsp:Transcript_16127/g.45161  ORF Transcript_16127/g.45161 Transcript_16127/m.45161 type:complete len:252 (+) Transcript_16127:1511-2266(+)
MARTSLSDMSFKCDTLRAATLGAKWAFFFSCGRFIIFSWFPFEVPAALPSFPLLLMATCPMIAKAAASWAATVFFDRAIAETVRPGALLVKGFFALLLPVVLHITLTILASCAPMFLACSRARLVALEATAAIPSSRSLSASVNSYSARYGDEFSSSLWLLPRLILLSSSSVSLLPLRSSFFFRFVAFLSRMDCSSSTVLTTDRLCSCRFSFRSGSWFSRPLPHTRSSFGENFSPWTMRCNTRSLSFIMSS